MGWELISPAHPERGWENYLDLTFRNFSSSSGDLVSALNARPRWYTVSSRALSSATRSNNLKEDSCQSGQTVMA